MKSLTIAGAVSTVVLSLCCAFAVGQEQEQSQRKPLPVDTASLSLGRELRSGTKITLVTIAQPTTRQACRVLAFNAEQVTCQATKGHPAVTYKETDLVAIIKADDPGHSFSFKRFLESFGLGGGAIAGAAFIASASMVAAVPVAVIGTILVIGGIVDLIESSNRDNTECALYLNPDQQLQVALK
jgi:hypothetical protein